MGRTGFTTPPRNRLILGSIAALLSSISFSLNVTLAAVSYEHGANIHGLNLTRSIMFWLVLVVVVRAKNLSPSVSGKTAITGFLLGILLCLEMYVMLGAILFIPVALAIVIMYTYPLMIAIYDWMSGHSPFSLTRLMIMLLVFTGLFLALSVPTGVVDSNGVLLAFAAALTLAALLIVSERTLEHHDNAVIMLHMLTGTCIAVIALTSSFAETMWPDTTTGWIAFVGSSGCYVLATFLLFTAVNMVGPLRTAIIDNTAPVWAVLFGFILLGQSLSLPQTAGVVIVVTGVLLIQWIGRPARSGPG